MVGGSRGGGGGGVSMVTGSLFLIVFCFVYFGMCMCIRVGWKIWTVLLVSTVINFE